MGQSVYKKIRFLALALTPLVGWSCGAPWKTANDVSSIFKTDQSLGGKVVNLCAFLQSRAAEPNLQGVQLDSTACRNAGNNAQQMSRLINGTDKQLQFIGFDFNSLADKTSANGKDQDLLIQTRTQLWLNKSLVGVLSLVTASMKDFSSKPMAPGTAIDIFGPAAGAEPNPINGVKKMNIKTKGTILDAPTFNQQTNEFHLAINMAATGDVTLNNDIAIDGGVYDGAVLVSVRTTKDMPYEQSLLGSLKAVAVVLPYGGDIYIDLNISMKLHSIGVDSIYKDMVRGLFESVAQVLVDKMKGLEK